MSNKYFCDICGKEVDSRILNSIYYNGSCLCKDVCDPCKEKYYQEKEKLDSQVDLLVKPFIKMWSNK